MCLWKPFTYFRKTQKEINLDDFLNEDVDLDWDDLKKKIILFEDSKEPENNCIGKLKNKNHFIHIKKVYDNGDVEVFDTNYGKSKDGIKIMKKSEFSEFKIIKPINN